MAYINRDKDSFATLTADHIFEIIPDNMSDIKTEILALPQASGLPGAQKNNKISVHYVRRAFFSLIILVLNALRLFYGLSRLLCC